MQFKFSFTVLFLSIIFCFDIGYSQELVIPQAEEVPGSVAREVREYLTLVERAQNNYRQSVQQANKQLIGDLNRRIKRASATKNDAEEQAVRAFMNQISKDHLKRSIESDWTPIFRGITAEHFNSDYSETEEGFAILLDRAIPITHIRVTNLTLNQSVIVRCEVELPVLATEFAIDDEWIWNGQKQFFGKMIMGEVDRTQKHGWRLGLASKKWAHGYKDKATIAGGKYGYGGFGFARANLVYDHKSTVYMWNDEASNEPYQLEISVTSKPLVAPNEGRILN